MDYYSEKLAGARLRRCYEIAPPRVRLYLDSEVRHVVSKIRPEDTVLELGCGYGRAAFEFVKAARHVVGIDSAAENLELARETVRVTKPRGAVLFSSYLPEARHRAGNYRGGWL